MRVDFIISEIKDHDRIYVEEGNYEKSMQADSEIDILLNLKADIDDIVKEFCGEVTNEKK